MVLTLVQDEFCLPFTELVVFRYFFKAAHPFLITYNLMWKLSLSNRFKFEVL